MEFTIRVLETVQKLCGVSVEVHIRCQSSMHACLTW